MVVTGALEVPSAGGAALSRHQARSPQGPCASHATVWGRRTTHAERQWPRPAPGALRPRCVRQPVGQGEATRWDAVPKNPSACAGNLGVD